MSTNDSRTSAASPVTPAEEPLMPPQRQHKTPKAIVDDGAVYKSTIDQVEVKYPPKYVGLTKEELERYVNDPYWRKLRWFFLVLFWFAWIAMFATAIIIVVLSPKCPPKPTRGWWQKKICYQVWTRSFKDSNGDGIGDLNGLKSQVKHLNYLHATAVWPVPLLLSESNSGYDVKDHKEIDPVLGKMDDFTALIDELHKYDMKFIMDMPLTTVAKTHKWFVDSENRKAPYNDYFRWSSQAGSDASSWTRSAARGEYYFHWAKMPNYPLLNWEHDAVRRDMTDVVKSWTEKNVDGFYLGEIQYMALLNHQPNWPKIHSYVRDLILAVKDTGRNITTFTSAGEGQLKGGISVNQFKLDTQVQGLVDMVVNNEFTFVNDSCGAQCFYEKIEHIRQFHDANNETWPMWEAGHPYVSRIASRMGNRENGELLSLINQMLPGAINTYYGDEIGMVDSADASVKINLRPRAPMQWDDSTNAGFSTAASLPVPVNSDYKTVNVKAQMDAYKSTLKMFKRLNKIRATEEAFLYGYLKLGPVNDNLLLIYEMSNSNTASFLGVFNFGHSLDTKIDLTAASYNVSKGYDVTAVVTTTNLANRAVYDERQAVNIKELDLKLNEAIVLKLKTKK